MSERPPRVRPGVRRLAIVAFAILLPIAAHHLWDFIEVRRLVREIERLQQKGEPVNAHEAAGDLTSELQRTIERGWGRRIIRGADVGLRVLVSDQEPR